MKAINIPEKSPSRLRLSLSIDEGKAKISRIDVSAKVIADLSMGIYRTPANALKELISNSFDADATNVIITTNAPNFDVFTVTDDGDGMTFDEFSRIMKKIGGSSKRDEGELTKKKRPIIGKIGIGLLAAGQICDEFAVVSAVENSSKKFEAIVGFTQFQNEPAYIHADPTKRVKIGEFKYIDGLEESPKAHYTKILLRRIDLGFQDRLRDGVKERVFNREPKENAQAEFRKFIEGVGRNPVEKLSEYDRLLWEISVQAPLAYLEDGPMTKNAPIEEIRKKLSKYDFHVFVDGLQLFKPILLPNDPEAKRYRTDYEVYDDFSLDEEVEGKKLKLRGYFYNQAIRLFPPELRGVLIRLRNVGIGGYDRTFFEFPLSIGQILAGTTAEVYVEEGLEQALNIDRNSFRMTDAHYLRLQEIIWRRIQGPYTPPGGTETTGIAQDARARSLSRTENSRQLKTQAFGRGISDAIFTATGEEYSVTMSTDTAENPVYVNSKQKAIRIHEKSPLLPKPLSLRRTTQRILCFYEVSKVESKDSGASDELFIKLLRTWSDMV